MMGCGKLWPLLYVEFWSSAIQNNVACLIVFDTTTIRPFKKPKKKSKKETKINVFTNFVNFDYCRRGVISIPLSIDRTQTLLRYLVF